MTDLLLPAIAVALAVPLAVLAVRRLAGLRPGVSRPGPDRREPRPTCAILVLAHDRETELPATLARLRPEREPGDRLLVVADNCIDRTAAVARAAGAEVLERFDVDRRGRDDAVAAGVDILRAGPPDVVVVIDSDGRHAPGMIDRMIRTAIETDRPARVSGVTAYPWPLLRDAPLASRGSHDPRPRFRFPKFETR